MKQKKLIKIVNWIWWYDVFDWKACESVFIDLLRNAIEWQSINSYFYKLILKEWIGYDRLSWLDMQARYIIE